MEVQTLIECQCGKTIIPPEGEIQTKCKAKGCKAIWRITNEGFWTIISLPFAQKVAKPKSKYANYMEWRENNAPKKRGKAGRR